MLRSLVRFQLAPPPKPQVARGISEYCLPVAARRIALSQPLSQLLPTSPAIHRRDRFRARGAMPGSIRKRSDRGPDAWELRVFLGRDRRGNVRHKGRLFRGSKRAAEKELSRLVAAQEFEQEVPPEPETMVWNQSTTINNAIEAWKLNGWADLSPVTVRRYENVWHLHITKTIGRERISHLSPYEVERYFRTLKA